MDIFLENTNFGNQNFLNPFIYHRDTSHHMVLKLFGDTPSGKFASILSNVPVKKTTFRTPFLGGLAILEIFF